MYLVYICILVYLLHDALTMSNYYKYHICVCPQVFSSPTIGPAGTIFFGSTDRKVYAINYDGTFRWYYETGGYVSTCVTVLVLGCNDQLLYLYSYIGVFFTSYW